MTIKYGGFWRRFCAAIVDGFVISMLLTIVLWLTITLRFSNLTDPQVFYNVATWVSLIGIVIPWLYIVPWIYFAWLHSSRYQATLGMLLFRMRIYTYAGERISFGRATGRYLAASFLSGWLTLGIGYLMIAFTKRKQALHDFIAHTLVVVTPSPSITIETSLKRAN